MPPTEIVWTAVIALASAAAMLAYRHPGPYRYFVMVHLGGAMLLLCMVFIGYTIGFVRGRDALLVAWVQDERVMADHHVIIPDGLPLLLLIFAVWLGLLALTLLPRLGFVSKDGRE